MIKKIFIALNALTLSSGLFATDYVATVLPEHSLIRQTNSKAHATWGFLGMLDSRQRRACDGLNNILAQAAERQEASLYAAARQRFLSTSLKQDDIEALNMHSRCSAITGYIKDILRTNSIDSSVFSQEFGYIMDALKRLEESR